MRTNTALLRFKKSSKSFKTRKDKETVAEVEEVGDVNWTMDWYLNESIFLNFRLKTSFFRIL